MADKVNCPTCQRTVGVLATGMVRRHNHPDGGLCPGGAAGGATVTNIGDLHKVKLKPAPTRGGSKHAGLTPDELATENAKRPPSKRLDRSGNGACGAKLRERNGTWTNPSGRCTKARGLGTDHLGFGRCKWHGGSSPNGKQHAALERAQSELARVKDAMTFYGKRTAIDPEQALLEEMQRTNAAVRWLEAAIAEWGKAEILAGKMRELDPAPDDELEDGVIGQFVDAVVGTVLGKGGAVAEDVTAFEQHTGLPTLVGVHSTEKALGFTDTEYAAWLKVYREERRHLAAVAKACIDANIAERRQAVLEARADMIRQLVIIALRIGGVKADENRMLEIVAQATQTVQRELPA